MGVQFGSRIAWLHSIFVGCTDMLEFSRQRIRWGGTTAYMKYESENSVYIYIYICSFLQKVFGVSLQASFPSSPLALLFNSNKLALALLFLLGLSFVSMFLARKDTANQVSWLDEA